MDELKRKQVSAWVDEHEEQILSDIMRLVSIGSVAKLDSDVKPYGKNCREVMEEYCKIVKEHGLRHTSYDDRVLRVDMDKNDGRPDIGLWNHLDVVPAGKGWIYEPFKPVIKEGFMIGRGVRDNKGPAIGSIYAAQYLKEMGVELPFKISLYVGLEEEKNMSDVLWLREQPVELPRRNLVLDTHFPVCYGEKGILGIRFTGKEKVSEKILSMSGGESDNSVAGGARVEIKTEKEVKVPEGLPSWITAEYADGILKVEAKGQANHVAQAAKGINAIYLLCAAISGQDEACRPLHEILKAELDEKTMALFNAYATFSVGYQGEGIGIATEDEISGKLLATATTLSLEDGKCSMSMNIRYPISIKDDKVLVSKLETISEEHNILFEVTTRKKSGYFPKEDPLVTCLMGAYNSFMGREEKPFTIAGAIYARMLPDAMGYGFRILPEPVCPERIMPAGHGNPHGADEVLSIEHYKKQLTLLIMSLLEVEAQDKGLF